MRARPEGPGGAMRLGEAPPRGDVIPMIEAVGYDRLDCAQESSLPTSLVLKQGRWFLVAQRTGDISPAGRCGLGLFHDDTRILSHYDLRFAGGPAALLSVQVPHTFRAQIDLAINDLAFGGVAWEPKHCIHVRREQLLDDRLFERLALTSYLPEPIDFWVELRAACDFADIFEVRGWRRDGRGDFLRPEVRPDVLALRYRGRDGKLLRTDLCFAAPPTEVHAWGARWKVRLEPGTRTQLDWDVTASDGADASRDGARISRPSRSRVSIDERRVALEASYDGWAADCSSWSSDVDTFDATLARAVDDLRALYVEVDGAEVISAGIPWYSTVFGRDSIITSLETLPLTPRIALDTLRYLARRQGTREDLYTEEQPGKILHELRRGELARTGEIPHLPYYGSIDATPLWVVLLHEAWRWTGDDELVRELMPNVERALTWIDRYGDVDGDGFVEYARTSDRGLVNQGWKDSSDGVPFPDGRPPEPPIALVEVQGYVYDAKVRAAALYDALGDRARAQALRAEADALRSRIIDRFWIEELGTFALALDRDKRPLPTVTTNAGHLLWSRVPDADRAAQVVASLLTPGMFSGWGIRTLSGTHRVFNPMSYHDGSIWPHDNALVILGMAHYGHAAAALPVVKAMHEAATQMEFQRLPELFCGMTRGHGRRPVLYPVSCSPQAWASGAFFMFLQAVLGLMPDAPGRVLHIRNPRLPAFLNELTIAGLRIGRSRVALQFRRHADRTLANLLGVEGEPLDVRIELR